MDMKDLAFPNVFSVAPWRLWCWIVMRSKMW